MYPQDIFNLWQFLPHSLESCQEKKWQDDCLTDDIGSSLLLSVTLGGTEHKPQITIKIMGNELKDESKTGLSSCLKPIH